MKRNWKRIIVTGLIAMLVVAGLVLLAHVLINSINIVEMIQRMHGG